MDLYSGYFFKIIKKSIREGTENAEIDMCILSAKYGIVGSHEEISTYDQRMDSNRAQELAPTVRETLRKRIVEGGYDTVVINAGKTYRQALEGFDAELDVETYAVEGDGIGTKGRALKQFLRGDDSNLERVS